MQWPWLEFKIESSSVAPPIHPKFNVTLNLLNVLTFFFLNDDCSQKKRKDFNVNISPFNILVNILSLTISTEVVAFSAFIKW